jgi:sigma-B regulation protein RsbU (phosphoserine phosphatase)
MMMLGEANERRGLATEALDRYREINLLYRISESIGASLDPPVILNMVLQESRQIIDADFGLLLLWDAKDEWNVVATYGEPLTDADLRMLVTTITRERETNNRSEIITDFQGLSVSRIGASVRSLLWSPLSTAEELLGGMLLGRSDERPVFVANDQKLLTALTSQAAIALDKAYLFEETKTYAQHLQKMNAIGKELLTSLKLDPLLHRILRAAMELTNSDEGAIFLIDEPTGELVFSVVEGGPEEMVGVRVPKGKGIVGRVADTGEPQVANTVQDNQFWFDGIDNMRRNTTRSLLAVPLSKQDKVIGVLEVMNRRDGQPFRQQDIARLTALTSQAVVAMETARLHQEELIKQRMDKELQLGHAMQSSLIPSTVPKLEGWEFAAWWKPAREVSGDFYDFIQLGDDVGVVMADVADKGVQAALFMTLTRSTVRASLYALREPSAGIRDANRLISQDATRGMFVTLCYAQFRPDSGDVTYVNAGHNPPFWFQEANHSFIELEPTGIFIGIDAGLPFEAVSIYCEPGDYIVLYTDGITEAMNSDQLQFGEDRLAKTLLSCSDLSTNKMLECIQQSLQDYVGPTPQSDDITMVIARRKQNTVRNQN